MINRFLIVFICVLLIVVAGETGYFLGIKNGSKLIDTTSCVNDRSLINVFNNQLSLLDKVVVLLQIARPSKYFVDGSINTSYRGVVQQADLSGNNQVLSLRFVEQGAETNESYFKFDTKNLSVLDKEGKRLSSQDIKKNDTITIKTSYDVKKDAFSIIIAK